MSDIVSGVSGLPKYQAWLPGQCNVTYTIYYLRDGVNACWRQIRQLAVWHVMHQVPSGTCVWRNVVQRTGIRYMFNHHTGIWTIATAEWRNVCLHAERAVFCVWKRDKLRS